ncbi:monocarboxylate transporter 7-like isoform X2 [Agrilus planipennis]|uniref:Monocarboxylate transporter 7-like isoform X2 n=1 Tax=Agrilus planipennis TaxID=224129 RepID=A0A7F5RLX5_AGRPL|nr:monocarboxylate transporter 7-like isoform X2 [Agrilus planipennis]
MTAHVDLDNIRPKRATVYKRVPPDGGYGYVIVAALTLFIIWPKRTIGLIGAAMIFSGNIGTIFITTANHLVITYGIIQGLGIGFLLPAAMTSFNDYFAQRKNFLMGVSQTITAGLTILYPTFMRFLLSQYGFRGAVAILAAINSHVIFTAVSLHPVKWHLKKVIEEETETKTVQDKDAKNETVPSSLNGEDGQLLRKRFSLSPPDNAERMRMARPSVISIGSFTVPVGARDSKKKGFWKSLDFSVLKDPTYYNLIIGVSLGLMAEYNFIAILPSYLSKREYTKEDIAMVLTAYFASDLVGRLLYTTCMALVRMPNRILFLGASIMCVLVRVAFSFSSNYWWVVGIIGSLGALRGFIHTPIVLCIADEYSDKFTSAFTLYMVICGIVAFIVGQVLNVAKYVTQSDEVVIHILTALYVVIVVCWSIELIYKRVKGIKPRSKTTNLGSSH